MFANISYYCLPKILKPILSQTFYDLFNVQILKGSRNYNCNIVNGRWKAEGRVRAVYSGSKYFSTLSLQ